MSTQSLNRRSVIKKMALLTGIPLSSGLLTTLLSGCQKTADNGYHHDDYQPSHFTEHQLMLLESLVELIIPTTDTPGAKAAGVHQFIDKAFSLLFSDRKKAIFLPGLLALDKKSESDHGKIFLQCSDQQQIDQLKALESEGSEFFGVLKSTTIFAYYTSEVGASIELKYVPMPGYYDGDISYNEVGRSYS
jgi:glucoside 3-dehydrogenase (cytochrome c) hitch-hiker subunit